MTANKESLQTVAIFWDFENCPVPRGVRVDNVATNICTALQSHYPSRGPVKVFSAYGNFRLFGRGMKEECTNAGVNLIDVPSAKKAASDKAILLDMFLFAIQNPPPCIILLISADLDFAPALHKLGLRGYKMVLAVPSSIRKASSLQSACQLVFTWEDIARGCESLKKRNVYVRNDNDNSKLHDSKWDVEGRRPFVLQKTEVDLLACFERADAKHNDASFARHDSMGICASKMSTEPSSSYCKSLKEHAKDNKSQFDSMLKCRDGHISKPKHKGNVENLQRQANDMIHHPGVFNTKYSNAANHTDQSVAQLNPNNSLADSARNPLKHETSQKPLLPVPLNYDQRPLLSAPSSLERHISTSLGPQNRSMHLQTIRPFVQGVSECGNFSGNRINGAYDVRGMQPVYDVRGMRPSFQYPSAPAFCPPQRPSFCPPFPFGGYPPPRF